MRALKQWSYTKEKQNMKHQHIKDQKIENENIEDQRIRTSEDYNREYKNRQYRTLDLEISEHGTMELRIQNVSKLKQQIIENQIT